MENESIITFKGFDKDLKCRGFQYKVGETFNYEGAVKVCESGFHACEYPLDLFEYYSPAESRFAVVEQSGELSRHDSDSNVASKSILIKSEIGIAGLIRAAIEYTTSRCNHVNPDLQASATGYRGAASATGDRGAASATGIRGAASATNDHGAALVTGDHGAALVTGDHGAALATGSRGAASATGGASVAIATGWEGRAQAAEGCAIVLVRRDDEGNILHIRASKVGDNGIKSGTWYTINENGEFAELGSAP